MVRSVENRNPSAIDSRTYKMKNEIFQLMLLTFRDFSNCTYFSKSLQTKRDRDRQRGGGESKTTYLKNFKNIKRRFSIRIHPNDEHIQATDEPSGGKRKRMADGTKRHGR